jgi:hypothetical protein
LGGKVIAEQSGFGGEPVTGELHAVAGVAGEADNDLLEFLPRPWTGAVAVRPHSPAFHRDSPYVWRMSSESQSERRAVG